MPTMPATLTVDVAGTDVTCKARIAKGSGNAWYKGSVMVEGDFTAEIATTVLEALTANYNGEALNKGDVHLSAPRKYGKEHEKAGQVVPGTGNNLSVTFSKVIDLVDSDGKAFAHTLMVSGTHITRKRRESDKVGIAISVQATRRADAVATMEGADDLKAGILALAGVTA